MDKANLIIGEPVRNPPRFINWFKPKIFGVGLSRTGTTSLNRALKILGYKSGHYQWWHNIKNLDAMTDITVTIRYKELDRLFPGSKFILTTRNVDDWLKSMKYLLINWRGTFLNKHTFSLPKANIAPFDFESLWTITKMYDLKDGKYDPDRLREIFAAHHKDVTKYFKKRPNDLLIMDMPAGDGWGKLCSFLNKKKPKESFPSENKARPIPPP